MDSREVRTNVASFIAEVFDRFTEHQNNYLTAKGFELAFLCLMGFKPSKCEVPNLRQFSGESAISKEQFCEFMLSQKLSEDRDQQLKDLFLAFDTENKGFITLSDFKEGCQIAIPAVSDDTVLRAFREVDRDENGKIGFRDFVFLMKFISGSSM